jgi:uncharacterized membrane protein YgcG
MSRIVRALRGAALALPLLLAVGCKPKIGDKCTVSTDCSQLGDRLCDTTQPDGYCTVFNCEPDTCPTDGDGVCVAFFPQLDPACGMSSSGSWPRFERTFCMRGCEDDSDCRADYVCAAPSDRNAQIVDTVPAAQKVCIPAAGLPLPQSTARPAICDPGPADASVPPAWDGGATSAGGSGGATSSGGSGGAGGATSSGGAGGTSTR